MGRVGVGASVHIQLHSLAKKQDNDNDEFEAFLQGNKILLAEMKKDRFGAGAGVSADLNDVVGVAQGENDIADMLKTLHE